MEMCQGTFFTPPSELNDHMRYFSMTIVLCTATVLHAASISSSDDPITSSPTLLDTLFPQLRSTREMIDYVAQLTSFGLRMPTATMEQSRKYLFERVFAREQCVRNRNLPQPTLAASEDDAYR